jgi:hypothetical protein
MNKAVQLTYSLLRVVTGLLFFQAGAMKLFGWFGGMPGGGTPPLMSQVGIGGLLEDGLFKTRANPRSCFVSSSCIWPHGALASGALTNSFVSNAEDEEVGLDRRTQHSIFVVAQWA